MRRRPTSTSPGDGEDRALVARVGSGDRVALELLYQRHAAWLTVRLESRCGDVEATDTAVQDTFLAVWRSASTFRGGGDVGAWLWGIAIRRLIDVLRRRRVAPVDPRSIPDRPALGDDDPLAYGELGPALAALPVELRAVLVATAIDGLSTKEAGRLLGVPQGTVKTRLMRARAAMQEVLS